MLFLQQEDPGPFRSRWQPTWVEVLQRNTSCADPCPDRTRVLRRLALEDSSSDSGSDDSEDDSEDDQDDSEDTEQRPASEDRLLDGAGPVRPGLGRSVSASWTRPRTSCPMRSRTCASLSAQTAPPGPIDHGDACDLLFTHSQLKSEASIALAQAQPMARMQLELERRGSPGDGSRVTQIAASTSPLRHRGRRDLQAMARALEEQVAAASKELVQLLMERDELHMAQDAMLIDVEDQTRRAHELALVMQRDCALADCGAGPPADRTEAAPPAGAKVRFLSRVFSWGRQRPSTATANS